MNDHQARLILLAGFITMMPVFLCFRLRAHTGEPLDRRQEGWPILLTLRPLALAAVVGLIAFLIDPMWMAWAAVPLPGWVRWMGVALGIGASALFLWTFLSLGRNLTDTVVTRRDAVLVTHGPYHWVRHPFYLAFGTAVVANALVTANAYLALTSGASFVAIIFRTATEERKLIERFGQPYVDYMQSTGRFLPRLRRRRA